MGLERISHSTEEFWSEVLRLLWETPMPKKRLDKENKDKISLSKHFLLRYTGASHENIWIEPVRDGCQVQVTAYGPPGEKIAILSGSQRAIDVTKQRLHQADQSSQSLVSPPSASRELASPKDGYQSPSVANIVDDEPGIDLLQEPQDWTVRTFADYVEALVSSTSSTHMKRLLHQRGSVDHLVGLKPDNGGSASVKAQYYNVLAARLEELFSRRELQYCISSRAQWDAINFFLKYYQFRPGKSFSIIKSILSRQGMDVRTRLWNRLLHASLFPGSAPMTFVRSLFSFAQETGIEVNADTGLVILRRTPLSRMKVGVCRWLAERQLLNNPLKVRGMISETCPMIAERCFADGNSAATLIQVLDNGVGSSWRSKKSINHILDVCAKKKFGKQAEEFLSLLQEEGFPMDVDFVTRMCYINYRCERPWNIVSLLNSRWVSIVGREDRFVIPYAFMAAWNRQSYNQCRVLWHYAAVKGVITYAMKEVVYWSLFRNRYREGSKWKPNSAEKEKWWLSFGKVVAGVGLDDVVLADKFPKLYEDSMGKGGSTNPINWIITADSGNRNEQLALVRAIIANDRQAVMRLEADFHLGRLLIEAQNMDKEWRDNNDRVKANDVMWMVENAIKVPLKKRARPLDAALVGATASPNHDAHHHPQADPSSFVDVAGPPVVNPEKEDDSPPSSSNLFRGPIPIPRRVIAFD